MTYPTDEFYKPRMQFVAHVPSKIVGMTVFEGRVLIATESALFELRGNVLHPIPFAEPFDVPTKQETPR